MRAADAVIANAPNACKALRDAYPRHRGKFVTLTNGYDRETFDALADDPPRPAPTRRAGPGGPRRRDLRRAATPGRSSTP